MEKRKRGRPAGSKNRPKEIIDGFTFRCSCGKTAQSPHKQSIMLCKHKDEFIEMDLVQ